MQVLLLRYIASYTDFLSPLKVLANIISMTFGMSEKLSAKFFVLKLYYAGLEDDTEASNWL